MAFFLLLIVAPLGARKSTEFLIFQFSARSIHGHIYLEGVQYPSLAAAVAEVPSGSTVWLAAGTYPVSATINLSSGLDLECSPNNRTILRASSSLNAPMFVARGRNHFKISGCVLDGNRSTNMNQFDLIQIADSSHGVISGNHLQNGQSRMIHVEGGSRHIQIVKNEIDHFGQPLPASIGSEGIALAAAAGQPGISDVTISHNRVHDGNLGIAVYPSTISADAVFDVDESGNRVFSNANDGFLVYSTSSSGGPIVGIRRVKNESYCNGWPANGKGFSTNCTPGFLQTGPMASSSGVGFDDNSPLIDGSLLDRNWSHDNFYEGFDITPQIIAVVDTAGPVVTETSGSPFLTTWQAGQAVSINGVSYLVSSVASGTSLTLRNSAGTQIGVPFDGPAFAHEDVIGNVAYNNGRGNTSNSGAGFATIACFVNLANNIAIGNNYAGFVDNTSCYVTHTGDASYSNDLGRGVNAEFACLDCLNPSYSNITSIGSNYGVLWTPKTSNAKLVAGDGLGRVHDEGVNDTWSVSRP